MILSSRPHKRRRDLGLIALMLAVCIGLAIPVTIMLTPSQETTVAGQYVATRGVTPPGGWFSEAGPARIRQIGNTTLDIEKVQVHGPLRPQLELGPLVQTRAASQLLDPEKGPAARQRAIDAVTGSFQTWYLWATALLVVITVGVVTMAFSLLIWRKLTHASRDEAKPTVADLWHRQQSRLITVAGATLVGTLIAWAGAGALTWRDTADGLSGVRSLRELVGASPVKLRPAGSPAKGYVGAVIGDSRASRLGGPSVDDPDQDDKACGRSSDSLAAQLGRLSGDKVLNLACRSATISKGLLGKQKIRGTTQPPQVARLLRMKDLRYVVVAVGPNDLEWSDFLRYCYGVEHCNDQYTSAQFDYRLARFDRSYGDLLAALSGLKNKPQIIVVGSYDVFGPHASCKDTQSAGHPGLGEDGVALLRKRNRQLNDVLAAGAQTYGFSVAMPRLQPLCQPVDSEVGRDLQGLDDKYPFHPTGVGMVRLAASVFAAINR